MNSIRTAAPEYYNKLFNQDHYWNVFPKLIVKKKLTLEARQWLTKEVTSVEIKKTMFQINPQKAPKDQMVSMLVSTKIIGFL